MLFRSSAPRPLAAIMAARAAVGCNLREGKAGVSEPGWVASVAARAVAEVLGEEAVGERIRAELVPWVLGSGDPVRARVQARRAKSLE